MDGALEAARIAHGTRVLASLSRLRGPGGRVFKLPKMIDIMPGGGLDEGLNRHRSTFGVRKRFGQLLRGERANQGEIPIPKGGESLKCLLGAVDSVALRPQLLIKGLYRVVGFGDGLAVAKPERQLAIGKVDEDFTRAPLPRCPRLIDSRRPDRFGKIPQSSRGRLQDNQWILRAQI